MGLLTGKVAIVTGAGRGLGAAHARRLAEEGALVVVNDLGRDENGAFTAGHVAASICEAGGQAIAHTEDISSMQGAESLLHSALDAFGRVDILINNAGILRDKSFVKLEENDWDAVLKVNLKSMYAVTRPVFAWMKENGGGVIVNTSSPSGLVGNFGQSNYAASKAGAWGLSNVLAIEGVRFGIRVWTLVPTAVSALTAPLMDAEMQTQLAPEHVAEVLLYMVSELSGTRTGHCLFASGHSVRELKLVSAEGVPGAGLDPDFSAQRLAQAEDRLFRAEPALTVMDFAK
ncbi:MULTISPECIES: SDR family NAD(P)-dependent oxidoreductase [unclassified Pseudomonas]|uniref:SDR family NAD(P)-dependent oxidoreductase n=1 Tax=unclassified Pseudomonas TaxID=196821 RepID=UPI0025EEBAD4|nr:MULTISPECIES: SDR family NAD(P)-dependent oxidoreductase [unclassified Pseudomonas]